MENFFKQEITYSEKTFNNELVSDTNDGWYYRRITKLATFKELDQMARDQHKFHFRLVTFYTMGTTKESFGAMQGSFTVDTSEAYDLTVEFINKFLAPNEDFTSRDREELLNDASALIFLSMELAKKKFYPFFQKLMLTTEPLAKT